MIKTYSIPDALTGQHNVPANHSRRRTLVGIGLSLFVHGLLWFFVVQHQTSIEGGPNHPAQGPLSVRLSPAAGQAPPASMPQPERRAKTRPARKANPVIALKIPTPQRLPIPATLPEPVAEPSPNSPPEPDMMAMIDAARERRAAANRAAVGDNGTQTEKNNVPSANDVVMANINHSLQTQSNARFGTSGVFQIRSMGVRMAEFSFRGWTSDARKSWRQVIEVDAGPQGDVELAVVRKMIELIRSHFDGDFNWESHRLHRVVVLSARIGDSSGLEAFMMREFFDGR